MNTWRTQEELDAEVERLRAWFECDPGDEAPTPFQAIMAGLVPVKPSRMIGENPLLQPHFIYARSWAMGIAADPPSAVLIASSGAHSITEAGEIALARSRPSPWRGYFTAFLLGSLFAAVFFTLKNFL